MPLLFDRLRRYLGDHTWLRLLLTCGLIAFGAWRGLQGAFAYDKSQAGAGSSIRMDLDTNDIARELARTPTVRATAKWWTGPWYPQVRYYRPLTMTAFWLERKLWGEHGRVGFTWTHRLCLLGFLLLLYGFFSLMAGPARAALAVTIFAAGWNAWLRLPTGLDAFNCWKDECDIWLACCFVICSWWFVLFLRGGNRRLLLASFGCWIAALGIKESAYCIPIFLLALLALEEKLRTHWRFLVPWFVVAPLAWTYRNWALQGRMMHTGSNGSWPTRWLEDAMGTPPSLALGDGAPLVAVAAVALVLLGLLWLLRGRRARAAKALGAWFLLAAVGWYGSLHFMAQTDSAGWLRFLNLVPWTEGAYLGAILSFYAVFWSMGSRAMQLGYCWIWITFLPLAFQPPTSPHVHFIVAPGWSLWLACGLFALPSWCARMRVRWLQEPACRAALGAPLRALPLS